MRNRALCTTALLAASVAACTVDNPAFEEAQTVCETSEFYVRQPFELADPQKLDVLFVVDNSEGSLANQQALSAAIPAFVNGLNDIDGLDWRVAVTSTDLPRDGGSLLTGTAGQAGCPAARPEVISRSVANAALIARCNVILGEGGDRIAQGFQAARLAVEGNTDTFSRSDARLLIVFVARRDDCTTNGSLDRSDPDECVRNPAGLFAVRDFAQYFANSARRLDGNPVSIVAIVGPDDDRIVGPTDTPQPACTGANGAPAYSGSRYAELAASGRLARNSSVYNICSASFEGILTDVVEQIARNGDDELCAGLPMSGPPQAVVLRTSSEAADSTELSPAGDYLALGETELCENGAVAISTEAHDVTTGHRAEVWFCTASNPAGQ